jgi:hypothetical protein
MHISNENDEQKSESSGFARLLRLQSELQARLVEETMRYVQKLRGPLSPTAPGTVLRPRKEDLLHALGTIGSKACIELHLENRQRAHTMVMPLLSPLIGLDGTTWYPESHTSGGSTLLAPGEIATLALSLDIPAELPVGSYHGAVTLVGFRNSSLPLVVTVSAGNARQSRSRDTRGPRVPRVRK